MNDEGTRTHGADASSGDGGAHDSSSARARRAWRKISEYFEAAENQEISWPRALSGIVSTALDYSLDTAIARQGAPGEGERRSSSVDGSHPEDAPEVDRG